MSRGKTAAVLLLTIMNLTACMGQAPHQARILSHTANDIHPEAVTVHHEGPLTGVHSAQLSQQLADVIGTMTAVHAADVLLTADQAYVAVVLHGQVGGASRFMKGAISNKIRTLAPHIKQVHVTDRPESLQRMEALRLELNRGNVVNDERIRQFTTSFQ